MQETEFNQGLLDFLETSPTPFHATWQLAKQLRQAGFQALQEADCWELAAEGRFYVTRNDSSLIAFTLGRSSAEVEGIRMVGAHTDSPCLKPKPKPDICKNGYYQLGLEVYGGALLNPWFDRDLSLAGRVSYLSEQGICNTLLDFGLPIAIIPSLAIHLDREANKKRSINPQTHLPALLLQSPAGNPPDFGALLQQQILKQTPNCGCKALLSHELSFYDTQPPALTGLHQEFISSARLDNLLSCYVGLQALLSTEDSYHAMLICNDHEEVGSASACGAQGPFLSSLLDRLLPQGELRSRTLDRSLLISTDNAHGIHPNYTDRHDSNHGPILNQGPVIKSNANQRYATNSESSAVFQVLCQREKIPVQHFSVRADQVCGSTIGPITASEIGVRTVDVGVPTFAMHSIREVAGKKDAFYLYQALRRFFREPCLLPQASPMVPTTR